jgi:hypothetical protein
MSPLGKGDTLCVRADNRRRWRRGLVAIIFFLCICGATLKVVVSNFLYICCQCSVARTLIHLNKKKLNKNGSLSRGGGGG